MNGRRAFPPLRSDLCGLALSLPVAQVDDSVLGPLLIGTAIVGLGLALFALWMMWRRRQEWLRARMREQWQATILRSIGDGVIATDAAGRVTFMNDAAQELTAWKEADAIQRSLVKIFQTLDPTTRQRGENPIDLVVREGRSTSTTAPILLVARDGAEHLVLSNAAPIRSAAGTVSGAVFVFRDVTQRELAESAYRASQEMFRIITDHISDYVSVVDLEGRRLFTSNSFERILASPRELYLTSSFAEVHPDDRERIRALFAETVRTGIGCRAEYRLLGSGGRIVEMESVATVIRDGGDRVDKVLIVSRDISERRRAEERGRAEREFSETLINSMPGIFYLYDARRKILRWNRNLENVTGYSAHEFETLDPLTYFPEDEKALVHERMLKCFAEGQADIEVNLLTKGGQRVPYYVTGFRLEVEGRPCMLGIGIDITHRRQAEAALREAHANLELKVAERTRDLEAANERLKELDRLKSQFLSTMSHELRTPLNSIIGFTGILRQGLAGPLNDEQKKQLGMVHASARHLLGLINDLLDLSRIESGKMEIIRETFAVADLVNEVVQSLAPLLEQKKLQLESHIDEPGLTLYSDRKRCLQILLNLANNALKFTDTGLVRFTVHATSDQVEIAVSDTGIGIKPENMAQLFEAFRQVDGSARRVYEGTGLGLYLSKQLVTMLGGHMKAESKFGFGSRFAFTVPRVGPSAESTP